MIGAALAGTQILLSGGAVVWGAWWTALSILAVPAPRRRVRRQSSVPSFAVVVPAHNEAPLIGRTLASVYAAAEGRAVTVYVVADNCDDGTADEAQRAGAVVLKRNEPSHRGKSFALDFALDHLRTLPMPPDAVVIVDADTNVSKEFFAAVGPRLANGAAIVQAHYAATGDPSSDVARLRRLAFSLIHWSRPLGASRIGLPTTLKGNGMAFHWSVIRDGFPGAGITEDAAATLAFARRGLTAEFEPGATVSGLMARTYQEALVQEQRWEGGRLALLPSAIAAAVSLVARGKIGPAAAAVEVGSPPLTLVAAAGAVGLGLALAGAGSSSLGVAGVALLTGYVFVGFAAARLPRSDYLVLIHAPRFVLFKTGNYLRLVRNRPRTWQRTTR